MTTDFANEILQVTTSLKSFAFFLTRDHDDADDLLQETQYRALSNEDKFAQGTNIKAWLFTIMKNIFINDYRRRARRKTSTDNTENQFHLNSALSVVGNAGESNILIEQIQAAINEVGEIYRKPFLMHFHGYKYHEIAEDMELPIGTVKSRIFFARKVLKEELAELKQ